ncbi:hypothetical protein Drorol1_Dr00025238 [Drosera rotundifolia]
MDSSTSHAAASPSLFDIWSERFKHLVYAGDINAEIALLETLSVTDLRLSSTALLKLSKLYSAKGLSLKADALQSRAASVNVDDDLVSSSSLGGGGGLDDEDAEARVSGDVDRPRNSAAGDSEGIGGVIGGNESSVDRLMKHIMNFMSDIADEFKIVVVEAIRSLCLKFPLKYRSLMNFLSNILREEGGFEYKKAIVDSIVILIRDIPDAKESGSLHLLAF